MTAPLNIISLSGSAGSGTTAATASAGSAGSNAGGSAGAQGFQDLFTVLLNLLTAQAAATSTDANLGEGANATSTQIAASTDQSGTTVDLGGLIDLKTILDLKALLAASKAKNGKLTDSADTTTTTATSSDGKPDTPDPLAAVLDLLIGALQDAADASPESEPLTLDAKSSDTLKALNALLASLSGDKPTTPSQQSTPLPADVVDKLKTLDQLLSNQAVDPELTELKTRVAELLGTSSSTDATRKTASDATAPSVAALLGQTGTASDKTATGTQRDVVAHVLDGAKTALNASSTSSDTGNTDLANQNQPQTPQTQPPQRQTQAAASFAAQVSADNMEAGKQSDPATDSAATLATQGTDRTQQAQLRTLPAAYTQQANRLDMPQIAFEISRQAVAGVNRFQIRLDPPEMGRIDVRLDLDRSGGMTAHLTVDRPETYDALQRDARMLERALAQTGLDSNKTNLEFSLRQNPFAQQNFDQGQNQHKDVLSWLDEVDTVPADPAGTTPPSTVLYRGSIRPGGVNLVA